MNHAVTIGFRADGVGEVIFGPGSFSEQRRAFRGLVREKADEYKSVEVWTQQGGRVLSKRCRKSGGIDLAQLAPQSRPTPSAETYTPPVWTPPVAIPVAIPSAPAPVATPAPIKPSAKPAKPRKA